MRQTHFHRQNRLTVVSAVLTVLLLPCAALGQSKSVAPEAEDLLKTAMSYLATQKRFSVDTRSTIEVVLDSGQKLQFDHAATLSVQRPDQVFTYDGKSLTLYNPGDNVFATVAAPGSIEEMMDFARKSLDIVAPAGDLIYRDAFEILMADTTAGFVVGKSVVEGVRCDHLAFRGPEVDWQVWIQEGDKPLPRKLVITTKDVAGMPQFAVVMTDWELAPSFTEAAFAFTPPPGAIAVEFIPLD
jgi:hypothetical protein